MTADKKIVFLGYILFVVLMVFPADAFCGRGRDDFKKGQDIVSEIKRGNFEPLIEDEEGGGKRVKKKYKTPEIKEALYQLLVNPPKGFWTSGEGIPGIYLMRIMGDIHETRAIPYIIGMYDEGVAMSFGRMGKDGLLVLLPKLKEKENNIPAVYSIALAEMARKGDVGYIEDEKLRKEVRTYLLKALSNSDETGRKYAVRGLGEFAIQGDTEAVALINKLATTDATVGKAKNWPIRTEAVRVLNKLKKKGPPNPQ